MNYRKNGSQQKMKYKSILIIMSFSIFLLLCNLSIINAVENPPIILEGVDETIPVIAIDNYVASLPNKDIILTVGDKTISGIIDENDVLTINYKNANKYSISASFAGISENPGYTVTYDSNTDKSTNISTSIINTDFQVPKASVNMENPKIQFVGAFLSILCVLGISIRII